MISIVIGILVYEKNDVIIIPDDSIRVRIIANSNNISDLYEKKKLKEDIKNDLFSLVKNSQSKEEAEMSIQDNLEMIKDLVSKRTNDFSINYGSNYFPNKVYKGVLYNSGNYNSLVITLGQGLGDNWWCVLYPPLCMIEDNPNTSDVEYRSFVLDWLQN